MDDGRGGISQSVQWTGHDYPTGRTIYGTLYFCRNNLLALTRTLFLALTLTDTLLLTHALLIP